MDTNENVATTNSMNQTKFDHVLTVVDDEGEERVEDVEAVGAF